MLDLKRGHIPYIMMVIHRYDEILNVPYDEWTDDDEEEFSLLSSWYETYEKFVEKTSTVFNYYDIEA